ncbi:MAG: hypothetical protein IPK13_25805 [Deltaproteobacteria bacterium]|nr:hypothetical protein [Deltaproteobacteria bacterium]
MHTGSLETDNAAADFVESVKATGRALIRKNHPLVLLVGALALAVGGALSLGILFGPLALGYARVCLRIARDEAVDLRDLGSGFDRFGASLFAALLLAIAMAIGSLVVVGGVVVGFFATFTFYAMAEHDDWGAVDSVKRSIVLVKRNLLDVALFWVLSLIVVGILGYAVVGGPVAIALATLLGAFLYRRISEQMT